MRDKLTLELNCVDEAKQCFMEALELIKYFEAFDQLVKGIMNH